MLCKIYPFFNISNEIPAGTPRKKNVNRMKSNETPKGTHLQHKRESIETC